MALYMISIRTASLALIVILAACTQRDTSQSPASEIPVQSALAQCGKDTDCKGDRICASGVCAAPRNDNTSPLQSTIVQSSTVALSPEKSATSEQFKKDVKLASDPKKLDRCEAIAFAKTYKTYGEVRWALTKSDDLAPIPPDEDNPDSVAGDGANCNETTCEMEWWSYRYGNLTLTIKVEPGVKQTLWSVTKIESTNQECS